MSRSKDFFLIHQQELDEQERIEHLDRWAAYLVESGQVKPTGETAQPKTKEDEDKHSR